MCQLKNIQKFFLAIQNSFEFPLPSIYAPFSCASFSTQRRVVQQWLHNLCWYGCCLNKQQPETFCEKGRILWGCIMMELWLRIVLLYTRLDTRMSTDNHVFFEHHQQNIFFLSSRSLFFFLGFFVFSSKNSDAKTKKHSLSLKNLTQFAAHAERFILTEGKLRKCNEKRNLWHNTVQ